MARRVHFLTFCFVWLVFRGTYFFFFLFFCAILWLAIYKHSWHFCQCFEIEMTISDLPPDPGVNYKTALKPWRSNAGAAGMGVQRFSCWVQLPILIIVYRVTDLRVKLTQIATTAATDWFKSPNSKALFKSNSALS